MMRTRTQIYLAGAVLFAVGALAFPVVLYRARRPRPRPYREELRERNRLAVLLDADATEYTRDWSHVHGAFDFDLAKIEGRERRVEAGDWIPAPEFFRRLRARTGAGPRRVA